MQTDISSLETAIATHLVALEAWLNEVYTQGSATREYSSELDCSYEAWDEIETLVGVIFDEQQCQGLSETSLSSLLFFASRNEECGRIIAWLGRLGPFSNIGKLTHDDFLFLCKAALGRRGDYIDHQLVACFHKIEPFTREHIDILLAFFDREEAYTKRLVINVLATKGFGDISELAQKLWNHDECEFTKLSALHALKTSGTNSTLLSNLIGQFKLAYDVDEHDYLRTNISELES